MLTGLRQNVSSRLAANGVQLEEGRSKYLI